MQEKRHGKRLPIGIELTVNSLYKENVTPISDLNLKVDVVDISSKGIGFTSQCIFPVGYFFIANIDLANDLPQIITDVRIIRSEAIDRETYRYGCEFVAISPSVGRMLDEFSTRI